MHHPVALEAVFPHHPSSAQCCWRSWARAQHYSVPRTPTLHPPGAVATSGGQSSSRGGGGFVEPKSPKSCVPKSSQINISFC